MTATGTWGVGSAEAEPTGRLAADHSLTAESRVLCTDGDSRRRFRRYGIAVTPFTHLRRLVAMPALARKAERAS